MITERRIKRLSNINDDLAVFSHFFDFASPTFSLLKGEFYDPEKFDLVPKRGYQEQQLKFYEQRLEELKDRHKGDMLQYDEQEKEYKLQIDQLKRKLNTP